MADIFLSYSKSDLKRVEPIVKLLQDGGWTVWWDTALAAGEHWPKTIQREIDLARAVVVVWSKDSIKKDWVYSEASAGLQRGILVPVLLDDVAPPMPFEQIQATKLINWRAGDDSVSARLLETAVHRALGDATKPAVSGEQEKWVAIKNSRSAAPFQAFLQAFPGGRYAETAKLRGEQFRLAPQQERAPAMPKWAMALAAFALAVLGLWMFSGGQPRPQIEVAAKPTLTDAGRVWEHIRDMKEVHVFEAYTKDFADFPTYVAAAKTRIEDLKPKVAAGTPPPPPPGPESPAANAAKPAEPLPWKLSNRLTLSCGTWNTKDACNRRIQGCTWQPIGPEEKGFGTCVEVPDVGLGLTGIFGSKYSGTGICSIWRSRETCAVDAKCFWDATLAMCFQKQMLSPPPASEKPAAGLGLKAKSPVCILNFTELSCAAASGCEWVGDASGNGGSCRIYVHSE